VILVQHLMLSPVDRMCWCFVEKSQTALTNRPGIFPLSRRQRGEQLCLLSKAPQTRLHVSTNPFTTLYC
jgi:hypothetical protein